MKCPACGKRLYKISDGEYYCVSPDCPRAGGFANPEFFGLTQEEINRNYTGPKMKNVGRNLDVNGRQLRKGDIVRVVGYDKDPFKHYDVEKKVGAVHKGIVHVRDTKDGRESTFFASALVYVRGKKD